MEIKLTDFALRHFDPKFGGTKILEISPEEFESNINSGGVLKTLTKLTDPTLLKGAGVRMYDGVRGFPGYAPFCKLIAITNDTDARVGSLPITLENYQYIRSGYSARREDELPVFSRWLDLPVGKPRAEWLVLVLYDAEQINKEEKAKGGKYATFAADYGVVAILGQSQPKEEPMKPETMLRNALGITEGGSGVPLDREKYLESVEFWSNHITVK